MPKAAIGLMARFPRPGTAKTRLAKTIGDERALVIYKQLLNSTCDLVRSLDGNSFCRTVLVTPDDDRSIFEKTYSGFDNYFAQRGRTLGERMEDAFAKLLSLPNVDRAMLIGADCPELERRHIEEAAGMLSRFEMTLGPAEDGGYYLIGLRKICSELFTGINYGTDSVMKETLAVAKSLKLGAGLLAQLRDLDNKEDMEYFERVGLI